MPTATVLLAIAHESPIGKENKTISLDNIDKLTEKYTARSPYKAFGCPYHSFVVYFSNLRRVGCAEEFGRKEPSTF